MSVEEAEPCYEFSGINEPVQLYAGPVEVTTESKTLSADCKAYLRLMPTPRITLSTVYGTGIPDPDLGSGVLRVGGNSGWVVDAYATEVTISSDANAKAVWEPRAEPLVALGETETRMSRLVFHLMNFRGFLGMRRSTAQAGKTTHAIEHLELGTETWLLEVHSLTSTRDTIKKLKEQGGFGITHVGSARLKSEQPFTGQQAEDLLVALGYFFSFANGSSCTPLLPVGFDGKGERCWGMWNSPHVGWKVAMSWCDDHAPQQLSELLPGFMKRWGQESWRLALREAMRWYLKSNDSRGGIDAGIMLTQAAIERLSYEYSVLDRKLIESQGFKDLRASDRFRLLFSSLDIPIEIPASLGGMTKLASSYNWLDSPHALTEIRNSLVHPEHKRRGRFNDAMFDAWNLGLWYFELTVLRLCGYSSKYKNRLTSSWVGQVEPVPWGNND